MIGTRRSGRRSPSNRTRCGTTRWAVRWPANQIGFGQALKGERTTVFSTRSNISGLWTKPVPEPMSVRSGRGTRPRA